jgi:hypothetical protein
MLRHDQFTWMGRIAMEERFQEAAQGCLRRAARQQRRHQASSQAAKVHPAAWLRRFARLVGGTVPATSEPLQREA